MSECMKDVNLRMLIAEEIGIPVKWPVKILVDNKAGIHFQKKVNPAEKNAMQKTPGREKTSVAMAAGGSASGESGGA